MFKFVATCDFRQPTKASNQKPSGLLRPLPVPDYPWHSISVDLITQLPATARPYTAIVDLLIASKRWYTSVCHDSNGFCQSLYEGDLQQTWLARQHCLVDTLDLLPTSSDKSAETQLSMSIAYNPQKDGQAERTNQTLEKMLQHLCEPCPG